MHPAQASAVGKRSPAARSTRSWFRLTGGFRHPSFGLFSLRRLTSPSVEAANLIAPLRPAGSLHPFRLGIPAVAALSAPLQDGLRFFRHPLPPPLWPFLAVGFPPSTGRMGLTLLSDGEFDRVGCVLPSGGGVVIVVGSWKPTILPAYLLVQATSLCSTSRTSTNVCLRSTFRSPLGPTRIEAPRPQPIVPGAWHVGSLLRTAG